MLKGIFTKCPQSQGQANTLTWFTSLRNNNEIKRLATTIARDPEGTSRLPVETFQQVFDRMEREVTTKTVDWETIIEFFTKRGKPLTKDEIKKLQEEDQRIATELEDIQKKEEENKKRQLAKLMEDCGGVAEGEDEDKESEDSEQKRRKREQKAQRR